MMNFLNEINKRRKLGLKVGFTASTFDMLHAGHCIMLEESKMNCDFLIVGLLTDPTNDRKGDKMKPEQTTFERWVQASSINSIDMVIPFDTEEDLLNMLTIISPDIRFVGEEYKGVEFTGYNLGGEIFYNNRKHNYSSTKLKKRLKP